MIIWIYYLIFLTTIQMKVLQPYVVVIHGFHGGEWAQKLLEKLIFLILFHN